MERRTLAGLIVALAILPTNVLSARKIIVPKEIPSIQKALDEAEPGDTVFVLNGVYRGHFVLKENVSLVGQDKERTFLRGTRMGPVVKGVNYSVIRNFTIERGETGVLCENTNTLVEHTIIRGNRTGIHCLISLPEVRNNVIYRNKWTGVYCELVAYGANTAIEHNIIAENGYSGLVLMKKSAVLVQNNIFYANEQYGIYVDFESKRSRIIHNNFFNNRLAFNSYAVIDRTNISRDPGFPATSLGVSEFLRASVPQLRGQGKDGADIGLMNDADRARLVVDSDKDGIPDEEDKCPDLKEDIDEFEDWDGCPDYDNDLDGIYDADDQCPDRAEDFDGFMDQDGCPDPDNDKDGICDPWVAEKGQVDRYAKECKGIDQCPGEPETANGFKDDDGCPDESPDSKSGAK